MRTPRDELPPHRSWTQVYLWRRCPRYYWFAYVEKRERTPLYVLASGKSVHVALEEHNLRRARGEPGLSASELVDLAVADLRQLPELDIPMDRAVDKLAEEALPPLSRYLYHTQREDLEEEVPLTEDDVEREMWFTVDGVTFLGYADVVFPSRFADYKFVGRAKYQTEVNHDGQLALYREELKRPGGLILLMRGKEVATYVEAAAPPATQKRILLSITDTVESMALAETTGHYPRCDAGFWGCKPGRCEYYDECQGRTKPIVRSM